MDSDRTPRREGPDDDRRWTRKGALVVCAAFGASIALLIFAGSLLVVPVIYLVLCLEGVGVAYLAISRGQSVNRRITTGYDGGKVTNLAYLSGDRVETLASYAKWAAKGSDFSRRDTARTVAHILGHFYAVSPSGVDGVSLDKNLSDAIKTVIYPYRKDPLVKAGIGAIGEERLYGGQTAATGRPAKVGRGRYLASLEEIVSKLEQGMDR
jgi:hypothetical protein